MRSLFSHRLFVFALLVVLALAAPAAAAAPDHGEKGPLDFTGIQRFDLGIYTIIVFCLLVFIVTKYAWPKIKEGLEKRETNIRGALDEARKDREDARVALEQAKKQLDEAALSAKSVLDEARRDAEALRSTEREAGAKDAQAERDRARREIEAAKDAALSEIYQQAVELATILSAKTLSRQVTADDHRRLFEESLAELKQSVRNA